MAPKGLTHVYKAQVELKRSEDDSKSSSYFLKPLCVVKIGLGSSRADIEHEKGVLTYLKDKGPHSCLHFPALFDWAFYNDLDAAVLVMERVGWVSSNIWMPSTEMLCMALKFLKSLACLHSCFRVIHGDIKPSNVCVPGDQVWLIDSGSAQIASEAASGLHRILRSARGYW